MDKLYIFEDSDGVMLDIIISDAREFLQTHGLHTSADANGSDDFSQLAKIIIRMFILDIFNEESITIVGKAIDDAFFFISSRGITKMNVEHLPNLLYLEGGALFSDDNDENH